MSVIVPFNLKFWNKGTLTITESDVTHKVVYLGNVLTPVAKGDGCGDKPMDTLWHNYNTNVKHEIHMKLTICNSGLKAITKEHGLTQYWANRITFCGHTHRYPKLFFWVYRHDGRKMKPELRCHAVLCNKQEVAQRMANQLNEKLTAALQEFKREKLLRQNARLSLTEIPIRKQLLVKGSANFRAPIERSKSAPKLTSICEDIDEEIDNESGVDINGGDDELSVESDEVVYTRVNGSF